MEKQVNRTTNDLISRVEALEALFDWELCYTWDEHCKEEMDSPYIVSPSSVIDKLPSAQRWYTGEPTEDGDYLVYKHGDDDDFNYFDVDTFYTHEGTVEYGTSLAYRGWQDDHDRVVAWMPLPEAPEVEE